MSFEVYEDSIIKENLVKYMTEIQKQYGKYYLEPYMNKLGDILEKEIPLIFSKYNISDKMDFIKCLAETMNIYSEFIKSEFNVDTRVFVYETGLDRNFICCLEIEDIRIKAIFLLFKIIQTEFSKQKLFILLVYSKEKGYGYLACDM